MEQYKFSNEVSKSIVQGILKGYKSYLNERNEKKEELIISSAYAWVKGNHIDHHVAKETKSSGIVFNRSKAGYSWGYLLFQNKDEKFLFLIKNASAIGNKPSNHSSSKEENYLEKMAKQFNRELHFTSDREKTEQLTFESMRLYDHVQIDAKFVESEVEELGNEIDRFYIVTYSVDEATKMISDIALCLPHPETFELYQVDSLTRFIDRADVEFTPDDFAGIKDDVEIETLVTIGDYGIVIEEEDKASDTEN